MRILIIEENSMVPFDRRVWYEATALRDAGCDVSVICPGIKTTNKTQKLGSAKSSYSEEELDGIHVYRFPINFAERGVFNFLLEYFTAFIHIALLSWKAWRRNSFDVLHICNPPDIFFPIGLFYRFLGAKLVFDHHDLFPEMILGRYQGGVGRIFYIIGRLFEFLTLKSADLVIATNESFMKIALERGRIPKQRITIVRNGPKIEEFSPIDPLPAIKKGYPFMVCFLGIMGEEDGVTELSEVIQYIVQELRRKDIFFVLIGDGSMRAQVETNIVSWGLTAWVEMPGLVRDNLKLRQYLATADICVSPEPLTPMNKRSTFIKVGEYMAMGKPIVAFDLPETRFSAQNAAVYVDTGDIPGYARAITELLDNPEARWCMGAIGRQRVIDSLGWEHQKQNLLQAYQFVTHIA